jgi:hypothetical protein
VGKLSALTVKAIRFPGGKDDRPVRFGDGDGLYLQVAFGDNKSWLLRYTLAGKAREMGFVFGGLAEVLTGTLCSGFTITCGLNKAVHSKRYSI